MKEICKKSVCVGALAVLALLFTGCATPGNYAVTPSHKPYEFIAETPEYTNYWNQVYTSANRQGLPSSESDNLVSVLVSSPTNLKMEFFGNKYELLMTDPEKNTVRFRSGVYPFKLMNEDDTWMSGAMMFYNIDKTLSLAKLGLGDKVILSPRLIEQAQAGHLGKYTMKFDDKDVLTYWVGNRTNPYSGGLPATIEVDFGGVPRISELKIDGEEVEGYARSLGVTYQVKTADGSFQQVPAEYKIEFTADGTTYRGYLQKLKANEYTAFVRIPCAIPQELLQAANQGTVSRFSVVCGEGDAKEAVAEIVISRK